MTLLKKCLDDLENRIEDDIESELLDNWKMFIHGQNQDRVFSPKRKKRIPPTFEWPRISINEALWDMDNMAIQQFGICSEMLEKGSGSIMNVRCNYGSSILMSLFDAEMYYMEDRYNTLPTSRPLSGGIQAIETAIKRGIPDIYGGLGQKVFEMGSYFRELMLPYAKIQKYIHLFHPDLQGPMDVCEVLWGSGLFIDIVDFPELVHRFLELITKTYQTFMKHWLTIQPNFDGYGIHWGMMYKGNLMIRDDSAMNFSPQMFDEFIRPYDQTLLNTFGGGAIHFCGRGDHYIETMSQMSNLYAVNVSQPKYNNTEKIYQNTVDKGILLIGFDNIIADEALNKGRNLFNRVHCW